MVYKRRYYEKQLLELFPSKTHLIYDDYISIISDRLLYDDYDHLEDLLVDLENRDKDRVML